MKMNSFASILKVVYFIILFFILPVYVMFIISLTCTLIFIRTCLLHMLEMLISGSYLDVA